MPSTSQYDASYGRDAGAQVNVVTKSGGNTVRGSLFEFLRNDALNANDWFRNRARQPRGVLRQNQYGGTLGGPVVKDKVFYFGSYQGTRQRNGITSECASTILLPPLTDDRSAAALGRLFAGQRGFYNTQSGGIGPAIAADGSNINPAALKLLQAKSPTGDGYLIPTPQIVGATGNFDARGQALFSTPCPFDEDQYVANVDVQQSQRLKWTAKTFFANGAATQAFPNGSVPGYAASQPSNFRNVSLQHTSIISPTLVNQVEIGYNRSIAGNVASQPFKFSDFGINSPDFDNANPLFGVANANLGGSQQSLRFVQNVYVVQDSLNWVRGPHNLRAGGGLIRSHQDENGLNYPGTVTFQTFADLLLGLNAAQNGMAAIGVPISNVLATVDLPGDKARAYRNWQNNLYVQDDYQISGKLTLNFGLRWEWVGAFSDANGRNTAFDIARVNPNPPASGTLAGYVVPSNYTGPVPDGVVRLNTDTGIRNLGQSTWNPRVGFAWQLPGTNRGVVRGGYGMFHSRATGQPLIQSLAAPPFAIARVLQGTDNATATLANPFPATLPPLPSFVPYSPTTAITPYQGFAQDFRPPTFQRYSLDTQLQLGRDYVLDVGYVGSHGTDLAEQRYVNQAGLASPSNPIRGQTQNTVANVALRVPYQGISVPGLIWIDSRGLSWYNGLSTSLSKRFSRGLQFLAGYTLARTLTTEPGLLSNTNGAALMNGDQNNIYQHYGPDPFVRENRLVVSFVYELPKPANSLSAAGRLLGGWAVSGVSVAQSGHPLFATYTNRTSIYGVSRDRPDLISGCAVGESGSIQSHLTGYFNTTCFAAPAVVGADGRGTGFGNSPIGIIHGPDQVNTDLAIIKRTTVSWPGDRANVEFRAEFFNLFNHPQFNDPGIGFGTAAFGQILSMAVSPRIIQFALKYNF